MVDVRGCQPVEGAAGAGEGYQGGGALPLVLGRVLAALVVVEGLVLVQAAVNLAGVFVAGGGGGAVGAEGGHDPVEGQGWQGQKREHRLGLLVRHLVSGWWV